MARFVTLTLRGTDGIARKFRATARRGNGIGLAFVTP